MYYVYSYLYDDVYTYYDSTKEEEKYALKQRLLHIPNLDVFLKDAVLTMSINKSGTFTFTIPAGSSQAENIAVLRSVLTVYTDCPRLTFLWAGRPIRVETDLYGNQTYTVEGLLSTLNDTFVAPTAYTQTRLLNFMNYVLMSSFSPRRLHLSIGNMDNQTDIPSNEPGKTYVFPDYDPPEGSKMLIFPWFAETDISDSLRYVDQYTGNGANGTARVERKLTRWWNSCESTMEIFQTKLIDYFGGFLEIYADQPHMVREGCFHLRYLDPEAEENHLNQTIEVGKNILELSSTYNMEDFYTAFYPAATAEDGSEKLLTHTPPKCFWSYYYGSDTVYPGNYVAWYGNFLINHSLYQKYGMILKKVAFSFDETDTKEDKEKAVIDFAMKMREPRATVTIKAVDLSPIESNTDCFQVGRQVKVCCPEQGIEEWMTIEELTIYLNDPTQCTVTLNGTLDSISKLVARG